jgi:cytochrome c553
MTQKIERKIVGYQVKKDTPVEEAVVAAPSAPEPDIMHEKVERPEFLLGSTYKIKTPVADHALYITINDIILNEDTEHEKRHPYEIFINSKSMEHFQWVTALTRVISACFRKGGDVSFLVDELCSVYAPDGGYFKKGGVFMPSMVADIGDVIRKHMTIIGLLKPEEMDENTKRILAEKKAAFEAQNETPKKDESASSDYPANATMCGKCHTKAVIIMDGCATCLSCADSKCG